MNTFVLFDINLAYTNHPKVVGYFKNCHTRFGNKMGAAQKPALARFRTFSSSCFQLWVNEQ